MTGKVREPKQTEEDSRLARERIMGEPAVRVNVRAKPHLNNPDNYEVPDDPDDD